MTLTIIAVVILAAVFGGIGLVLHSRKEDDTSESEWNFSLLKTASFVVAGVLLVIAVILLTRSQFDWFTSFSWAHVFVLLFAVLLIALIWRVTGWLRWLLFAVVALMVFLLFSGAFSLPGVDDTVNGGSDGASGMVDERVGATALSVSCDTITNGIYPSRADNLAPYASGPSMRTLSAEEVFDEFSKRACEGEVQRAFILGELGRDLVLTGEFGPEALNEWAAAFANDDLLSEEVMGRMSQLFFSAEPVSEEAISAGETFKILTITPEGEERPTIATVANYIMPVGGLDLWKFSLEAIGDSSPLDDVRAVFFEPTLGVFFIPSGVELDAEKLDGAVDYGELFGNEEQDEVLAAPSSTTTSTSADGTVTSTSTAPDGTVTVITTDPDGTVTTVTVAPGTPTTPGPTVPGTPTTPGPTVPGTPTCPGDPECPTTTTVPGPGTTVPSPTTTTCPSCTTTTQPPTTTTTRPPTTTTTRPPTTTTTTSPPTTTTTTTEAPKYVDFKVRLVSVGENLWQLGLRPDTPTTGCISGYSPPLGTVFNAAAPNYGGLTLTSAGKLAVRVTGIGCNGWLNTSLWTSAVDPPGGGY